MLTISKACEKEHARSIFGTRADKYNATFVYGQRVPFSERLCDQVPVRFIHGPDRFTGAFGFPGRGVQYRRILPRVYFYFLEFHFFFTDTHKPACEPLVSDYGSQCGLMRQLFALRILIAIHPWINT
jgi:hypothetical protein